MSGESSDGSSLLDFTPTPEFPGLQYIEFVQPDSAAGKAGLLVGDFILEVRGFAECSLVRIKLNVKHKNANC